MILEIKPEPSPEQRAAIFAAIVQLLAEEPAGLSVWWEAGVREAVEDGEDEEPQATARPRSRLGATRA